MDGAKEDQLPSPARTETAARQDLSFLLPMIDRIKAVEIKFTGEAPAEAAAPHNGVPVPNVEARLAALEAEISAIKDLVHSAAGVLSAARDGAIVAAAVVDEPIEYAPRSWQSVAAAAIATIALLMLAHWLIVVVFDLRLIVLRIASIAIPLVIAMVLTLKRRIVLRYEIGIALAIGLVAVFGMAYVTSIVEKSTWLPENAREWRETLEYVASVAFAYVTGVMASSAWQAHVGRSNGQVADATLRLAQRLAKATGRALETGSKVGKQVKTIHEVINTAIPAATAVVSVVTGVNSILG
jgi:hypothetical protein